jgi:tetratricopeptide (TPR) repeat protein
VLGVTEQVVAKDSDHVKTLFRRGVSLSKLGRFEEARQELGKAQALAPDSPEIAGELRENEERARLEQARRDRLLAGMMAGLSYSNE